ncbi:MAG: ABC transporter ATP-binding protein [Clostridia bacterium]|nr:ABC transporter ATP-binding protein [Clostridia bacterium]
MHGNMGRMLRLFRPYKAQMTLALSLEVFAIITRLIVPRLTRMVVNDVITDGQYDMLYTLCGLIVLFAVTRVVSNYVRAMRFQHVSQNIICSIRSDLYDHLQEMPWEFYDKNRVGEIMSRMTGDLNNVRNFLCNTTFSIFTNSLCFVGSFVFMMFMSPEVTLMVLSMAPVIACVALRFRRRIRPVFSEVRELNAVLNTRTQENLAGMHIVKAFNREDYEMGLFEKDNRTLLDKNLEASWVWSSFMPFMDLLSNLCTPITLAGGALMVYLGRMDIGTLVGVTGYIWMLTNPMRQVANIINATAMALTGCEKVFYYMDLGSSIKEPADAKSPEEFKGHVVFDHVTFAYGDSVALKDICLEAKSGETIAVMGATGSGKSTLINLLGRFYDIRSGSLLIDGIDVRKHRLKPLRQHIGFVPQESFLFSDTINDNIRYGRPEASLQQVIDAAQAACADEFIRETPQGYDTVVGERGLGLSGGQRQRASIARAVLIQPSILVLDDSTSAVDMETEYEIQQNFKTVMKDRTTFIIAHRISSVKNADQIIVLKDGEIAERGRHKELMELGGIYAGMVRDQMSSAVKVKGVA